MSIENLVWILFGVIYASTLVLSTKKKFDELAKTEVKVPRKKQTKNVTQDSKNYMYCCSLK